MTNTSATNPEADAPIPLPEGILVIVPGLGVCRQTGRAPCEADASVTLVMLESVSGRGAVEIADTSPTIMRLPDAEAINAALAAMNSPSHVRGAQYFIARENIITLAEHILSNDPARLALALRDTRHFVRGLPRDHSVAVKHRRAFDRMAEIIQYATGVTADEARARLEPAPVPAPAPRKAPAKAAGRPTKTAETAAVTTTRRANTLPADWPAPKPRATRTRERDEFAPLVQPRVDKPRDPPVAIAQASSVTLSPAGKALAKPGATVICRGNGIYRIMGVHTTSYAGTDFQVLSMSDEWSRLTLSVPLDKIEKSLRAMPTVAELDEALKIVGGRAKAQRINANRWMDQCHAKLQSFDPQQVAEVVRDVRGQESHASQQLLQTGLTTLARMHAYAAKYTLDTSLALFAQKAGVEGVKAARPAGGLGLSRPAFRGGSLGGNSTAIATIFTVSE